MYANLNWFYDKEHDVWVFSVNGFISRKCYKKARWLKGYDRYVRAVIKDEQKRIADGYPPCDHMLIYKFGWNRGGKRK